MTIWAVGCVCFICRCRGTMKRWRFFVLAMLAINWCWKRWGENMCVITFGHHLGLFWDFLSPTVLWTAQSNPKRLPTSGLQPRCYRLCCLPAIMTTMLLEVDGTVSRKGTWSFLNWKAQQPDTWPKYGPENMNNDSRLPASPTHSPNKKTYYYKLTYFKKGSPTTSPPCYSTCPSEHEQA